MHEQGNLPIEGIHHINQPYWYAEGGDLTPEDFGLKVARELEEKIIELGEENVAAFVAEPIQGAGGVIVPPSTYWPEIKRICAKYQILLVADEVISGFGRLGCWFGHQHYDFEPDLAPIAKGLSSGYLPIGGVLVSDRVAEVMVNELGDFYHGYTYSGHPVACAAAIATLELFQQENLFARAGEMGPVLGDAAHSLIKGLPNVIGIRSLGLAVGVELASIPGLPGKRAYDIFLDCYHRGVLVRNAGDNLVFAPPFIVDRAQIETMVGTLADAIKRLA